MFVVTAARPSFSDTLHTSEGNAKLDSPYTLLGNTDSCPYLATPACLPGNTATYRVKVEGNNIVRLGAMRNSEAGGMDLQKMMGANDDACGFGLYNRYTFIAGKVANEGRKAGPGEFPVPVTLDITIDASAGTIAAAVVGGEDLGIIISGVKTDSPLHLAVATDNAACKVTLLEEAGNAGVKWEGGSAGDV